MIDSFYKKDSAADFLCPRQIVPAIASFDSEIDKVASWIAAQQEDEQEEEGPEQAWFMVLNDYISTLWTLSEDSSICKERMS